MVKRTKVSVVIASWNGKDHLETCLPALESQRAGGFDREVLVLDNGSSDGSADWVRSKYPHVRLIESPTNLGFCAANNRLVEAADGDLIAFVNNDTRPDSHWLASLVDSILSAKEDVAAVAGKILDWEGKRLDFGRGVLVFDGHAFQLDYHRPIGEARIPAAGEELPFACGGNMLIRREAFLDAGGFDEEYFAYLEDVDLGWRLWSRGQRVIAAPEGVVHHRSGATGDRLGNAARGALSERNAFWTAYKNYQEPLLQAILPLIVMTLTNRLRSLTEGAPLVAALASEPPGIFDKISSYGLLESFRRGLGKVKRAIGFSREAAFNDQTRAQTQALDEILNGLDGASARRRRVQAQRVRSDTEYFERFPVYLVPTYPGDDALFDSPAFENQWPAELPFKRTSLSDIMALD